MDDYRDADKAYVVALEKKVLDAGLRLPSIYGIAMTPREKQIHARRVMEARRDS